MFDVKEYEKKLSSMTKEQLKKEWDSVTEVYRKRYEEIRSGNVKKKEEKKQRFSGGMIFT